MAYIPLDPMPRFFCFGLLTWIASSAVVMPTLQAVQNQHYDESFMVDDPEDVASNVATPDLRGMFDQRERHAGLKMHDHTFRRFRESCRFIGRRHTLSQRPGGKSVHICSSVASPIFLSLCVRAWCCNFNHGRGVWWCWSPGSTESKEQSLSVHPRALLPP